MEKKVLKKLVKRRWIKFFEYSSLIILFTGVIMRLCGIKSWLYVMAISIVLTIYYSSWQIEKLWKKIEKLEKVISKIQSEDKNE
jgi:hypothetical protein